MIINTMSFVEFIERTRAFLETKKEYVSGLDAATGDGDHWSNLYLGFERLEQLGEELKKMELSDTLKKIGMTMMSVIGGSSGILYGGAYMAASREIREMEKQDISTLYAILHAMLQDMMKRGKVEPGQKTMIDALYPAVKRLEEGLNNSEDEKTLLTEVIKAAKDGAEATKEMKAVKGRASYQLDKGVGHLDPGAVTMSYQLTILLDLLAEGI